MIDTETLELVDRVDGNGQGPLRVDHGGRRLFAVNESMGSVTVYDTATRKVLGTVEVGGNGPFDIALDPEGGGAYVTGAGSADESGDGFAIAVIDLANLEVLETLRPDQAHPLAFGYNLAVARGGNAVFVTANGLGADEPGRLGVFIPAEGTAP